MRTATLVAAPSRYVQQEIQRLAGESARTVVLPPPVSQTGVEHREPVGGRVLIAGRLVRSKGFADAITAIARVSGAHLVIAGDGPLRSDLERLARDQHVQDRTSFLGWLDRSALDLQIQLAQVVLFPSGPEAFGLVGVEAALNGRPVIAYDTGGVRDWLTVESGILVPLGDVTSLTDALAALLHDPVRCRTLGQHAAVLARRFSLASFGDRVEEAMQIAVDVWWRHERLNSERRPIQE